MDLFSSDEDMDNAIAEAENGQPRNERKVTFCQINEKQSYNKMLGEKTVQ